MRPQFLLSLMVLGVSLALPVATFAQSNDIRPLLDRMDRLERDIRTLNLHISRGGGGGGSASVGSAPATSLGGDPALVRLAERLTDLETDVRNNTGQLEQLGHRINQMADRMDKLVSDIDYRLSNIEQRMMGANLAPSQPTGQTTGQSTGQTTGQNQPGSAATSAPAAPAGTLGTMRQSDLERFEAQDAESQQVAAVTLPAGTPRERYDYSFRLLRQFKWEEAEQALTQFLESHGEDPLAGNARYWLGETHYVRQQYAQAAKVFYEGFQLSPGGPKAADSLLKLGMSLSALDKKQEACATFGKLAEEFPKVPANISNALKRERARNDCP